MLHLHNDGTLSIDFDGMDGQPVAVTVRRPSFGAYKRLRVEHRKMIEAVTEYAEKLKADDPLITRPWEELSDDEKTQRNKRVEELSEEVVSHGAELAAQWWQLALVGDDTFAGLAMAKADVPTSVDLWPVELCMGACAVPDYLLQGSEQSGHRDGIMVVVMRFWQSVPLDPGGPRTTMN